MFKDELEGLIQDQLTKGNSPTGLLALRQIADLVMASYMGGAGPLTSPISESVCVIARERGRTRISPWGLDCYSASTPSVCIMQAEYLHCQGAELSDSCDSEQPWNSRNGQKVVDGIFFF